MGFTIHIERRCLGIVPEADGAILVGDTCKRNALTHVQVADKESFMAVAAMRWAVVMLQRLLELGLQPLMGLKVVRRLCQHDLPIAVDGDAILRVGKVF